MAFPQSSFKESVESHENISCYLVNKQKLFCTLFLVPVGLPDACLQDLLLGLSRSCSNTNCHVSNGKSDNGTELMSHKCSAGAIKHDHSEVTQRNCSLQCRPIKKYIISLTLSERWKSKHMSTPGKKTIIITTKKRQNSKL